MTTSDDKTALLAGGLDQVTRLLGEVTSERLDEPTPCEDWVVADLVDHLVRTPVTFARMVRGDEVDWTAPIPHVESAWAAEFRMNADSLLSAMREAGDRDVEPDPDMQCAEIAVHTWDLATALGRSTSDLDPEVAERGLAFMEANLKPEMRGDAFKEEQPAPAGADAYGRIAAFAGRGVTASR